MKESKNKNYFFFKGVGAQVLEILPFISMRNLPVERVFPNISRPLIFYLVPSQYYIKDRFVRNTTYTF